MMLADALAERGRLSGAEVDALIGGGSTLTPRETWAECKYWRVR
jgi:hypothetical protein